MVYKFSELFHWSSGKPVKLDGGAVPVYGSNGIIGYTTKAKYRNKIILGRVGAYCGSVEYYPGSFNASDNTLITTCNEDLVLYKYAYYLLKQYKLNNFSGGSAQPLITQSLLKPLKCDIPEIKIQKRIASILSAYDDLIENNNRRIKILEKMAENLYKEWFVRFRFPGYENSSFVASSIGRIPEGFSVLKMQDVIDYHIGGGWGSDVRDKNFECEAFVIRGTDFPYVKEGILSTCPRRYHKIKNYRTRKLEEGDIILEVSGGTAEQPVGRALLVTKDTLRRFGRKLICASFCKLVRLKRNIISPYYFIYWMNFLYSTRIIEKFQLQSTGIINFKFEYFFKKGDILLPPVDLMHIFVGKIKTIKAQIDKLAEVNENLTKQRDMLLPRLMSGTLEV